MNFFVKEIMECFGKNSMINISENELKLELIIENDNDQKDEKETADEEDDDNGVKSVIDIELFEYMDGKYLLEFIKNKGEFPIYYQNFLKMKKIVCEHL